MSAALRWSHVALNCRDQAVTEEFYRRWFGFQRARLVDLGEAAIVFIKQGEVYLELFAAPAPEPAKTNGKRANGSPSHRSGRAPAHVDVAATPASDEVPTATGDGPAQRGVARHLAFQTDDLDAFLARIGDEVPISLGPMAFDAFIPGWRTVWVRDPDGVIVEVSQGYHDAH
jgi:glyoxylase I family protein